ncbi:molybdenum cofactor biosynthesis protein MoaE [Segetibacter aerophilus]|uniref:Molybdopterin synthase catalytic subunit n=1 Tax=Segetibacter aerophilus TaxID=670293 RepID=A0A512BC74_9BACT|nr:molybdenum cofactor biosynthesis protein MoaE [Segetibacter aerophilus]GEO09583.1 molybdopterin (MPT) converting factor, subunit 2 [Segetibacter aerophilus]
MLVKIVEDIDVSEAYQYLESPDTGAVNLFIGTVRNHTKGKEVVKLVFEAYKKMALKEMNKLAEEAKQRWPIEKLLILHITGEKKPGEAVVAIGVTSAHRDASFEACRFLIDELKKTVPIWKKEFYIDNSVWVNAHP